MIATALRHHLYDLAIGLFFDVVGSNFAKTPVSYVGNYWIAVDDDQYVVAYGRCSEQKGSLVLLDSGESEYVVHTELFRMQAITRGDVTLIQLADDDEEGEFDTRME